MLILACADIDGNHDVFRWLAAAAAQCRAMLIDLDTLRHEYGHADNPVIDESGWLHPRILGRTYGIDTISRGVLTAGRFPDLKVFQSRRHE